MKFIRERKTSLASEKETRRYFSRAKTYLDQPSHFTTPHAGEKQLGKPEVHHKFEFVLFEDKSRADKTASVWKIVMQRIF